VPTAIEPQLLTLGEWTFRLRRAQTEPARLLILIHGWMGDENSMWGLSQKISPVYEVLAPRAPFPVAEGGYSWRNIRPGTWGNSSFEDLHPAAESLLAFVKDYSTSAGIIAERFDLMGFSQGAAMVYTLAILHPDRIQRMVALSGFIPENAEGLFFSERFSGKPIFISHGRKDELIHVEQARRAAKLFREAGAQVNYCESDAGHKVSTQCLKEMEIFLGVL
jgi:phospholipase/carboxylesterase